MAKPDETPAESAARDDGVPLTESQRVTRESLTDAPTTTTDDDGEEAAS